MGASEGLGYLLIDGQQTGKPAQIVSAIVTFAILGKLTDWILTAVLKPLTRWQDTAPDRQERKPMLELDTPQPHLSQRYARARPRDSHRRARRDRRRHRRLRLRQEHDAAPDRRPGAAERRHHPPRRRGDHGPARADRRRVPGAAAAALAQRRQQRRLRPRRPHPCRQAQAARRRRARARRPRAIREASGRASCPAARRSASPSPARWSASPR